MNKRDVLLVLVILIPIVYAQGYSQSEYSVINVELDASLDMEYKTDKSRLDSLEADVQFFPRNDINQEVISLDTFSEPNAAIMQNDNLDYRWSSFNENKKLDYGYSSRVRVNNNIIKINKQINFPVSLINDENLMYIEPTEYIDITPQIKDKANEIVKGQDDLFEATVRLAEWTRTNVRYDLSTLTESVVQKSSWVLAAREGVCDEITNLFVSFLRSLHIPTRYVSGMAYSSAINGFGPHAWAEVYFPNYGWVPFDVTFGQYGWIDPGHVKMIESKDAKEPSVTYNWRSIDVQIADKNFNVSASLANKGENIKPLLELKIIPLKNNLKGGSYVPIEVKVKNLQNYYLSSLVFFTIAPYIEEGNEKAVLLKPGKEKSLYWILKVDDVEDKNKYIAMLEVQDSFGSKASSNLNFADDGDFLSLDDAKKLVKKLEQVEEVNYKYNLFMDCDLDKSAYYMNEEINVNCNLKNTGNIPLEFDLCIENNCEKVNLRINEEKLNVFIVDLEKSGSLKVTAKNGNINLESSLDVKIYNEPKIEVLEFNYNNLSYNEKGEYEIILNAEPEIYELNIKADGSKTLKLEKFFGKQRLSLPFKAYKIGSGEKEIILFINYKDKNGKLYKFDKKYKINIKDVNTFDKFLVNVKDIFSFG